MGRFCAQVDETHTRRPSAKGRGQLAGDNDLKEPGASLARRARKVLSLFQSPFHMFAGFRVAELTSKVYEEMAIKRSGK
jgi:hypothetical protein